MAYNTENAEREKPKIPENSMFEGAIIHIKDDKLANLVQNPEKWGENPELQDAIEVTYQFAVGEDTHKESNIYTYNTSDDGKTVWLPRSNLDKYHTRYGKLPDVGDKIEVATDSDGYPRIKIGKN